MDAMDNQITILCQMPLEKAVKDARVNNISLDHIKKMAKHLSLSSSKSRSELVNDIRKKHADVQTLKEILNARSLDSSDSEDDNPISIIQNQNSVTTYNEDGHENENIEEGNDGNNSQDDGESVVADPDITPYRKDKNTMPRLINILFEHPDAVARSHMLATRIQLQNKETYDKQKIFTESMLKFNDRQYNSGGLVTEHEVR